MARLTIPRSSARSPLRRRLGRTCGRVGLYSWLGLLVILVIAPLYWLVRGAFGNTHDFYSPVVQLVAPGWPPRDWPPYLDWSQFQAVFRGGALIQLLNSAIIAVPTTALTIVLCTIAAYSLSRLRYPGRDWLARSLLLVYLAPQDLLVIPMHATMASLHLVNTYGALILADLSFTTPFCTWMLICYLKNVPSEIEEAALIDGSSRLVALFRVDLPLIGPGLVAAGLISFCLAWGASAYAFVLELDGRIVTLALAVARSGENQLMALSLLYVLPVVVLYLLGQRFVIEGLATGAVKA